MQRVQLAIRGWGVSKRYNTRPNGGRVGRKRRQQKNHVTHVAMSGLRAENSTTGTREEGVHALRLGSRTEANEELLQQSDRDKLCTPAVENNFQERQQPDLSSPYNREGQCKGDPCLPPHAWALVVPAVAEVYHGISDSGEASERVGYPNWKKVANHRSEHDPVVGSFSIGCGSAKKNIDVRQSRAGGGVGRRLGGGSDASK